MTATRTAITGLTLCLLATRAAAADDEPNPPPAPDASAPPSTPSADPTPEAPADCAAPATTRAPDPRCGETLDGRPPAQPSSSAFARGVLVVPRVTTQVLLWPVVETSDVIEHYRLFDWMTALLTTDDGLVGIRPILNYATGFIPSVGARLFWRRLPGRHELSAHFETAGPRVMIARLHFRPLTTSGLFFDGTWGLRDDRLFAGIGPNSNADLKAAGQGIARYGSDALSAELRWLHRLPARLFIQLHADGQFRNYQSTRVSHGTSVSTLYGLPPGDCAALGLTIPCVNPLELTGFESGMRLLHGGASLRLDLRTPGREGAGFSLFVDGTYAHGISSDPERHAIFSAESAIALGGINRAFILRGRAAVVESIDDRPINFEELISPSGAIGMRGFPEGRFRDLSGVVGTAEYRWYISSYLDATLFSDVGTVAGHNFAGLGGARWFPTFGVGLRSFLTQGAYWEAVPRGGVQFTYAPDYGFRLLLTLAAF